MSTVPREVIFHWADESGTGVDRSTQPPAVNVHQGLGADTELAQVRQYADAMLRKCVFRDEAQAMESNVYIKAGQYHFSSVPGPALVQHVEQWASCWEGKRFRMIRRALFNREANLTVSGRRLSQ